MSKYDGEDVYEDFAHDYDYDYKPREDRRDRRIELLEERIKELIADANVEEVLRENSPALQDAWEKYQIVLRTVR